MMLFSFQTFAQSAWDITCAVNYVAGPFDSDVDVVHLYAGEVSSYGSIIREHEAELERKGSGAVLKIRHKSSRDTLVELPIDLNFTSEKREPLVLKEERKLNDRLKLVAVCRAS